MMFTQLPEPGATLSQQVLNRTLLARQHLLQRQVMPAQAMIKHLVGMQSQEPPDPFIGLWTRIEDFDPAELDRLMLDREAVRLTVMRGTIHLTTAGDAYELRPVVQAMLERLAMTSASFASDVR